MRLESMFVGSLMLSAMAFACSADTGVLEGSAPEFQASEDDLAQGASEPEDIEALKAGVITAEESALLASYFERVGHEPTAIEGRILHWEDAWSTVGDVLSRAELERDAAVTEKAYVNTTIYNPPTSGTTFQFLRPEVYRIYWYIVPNDVPNGVFNAVKDVVAEFPALIGNDCLLPIMFQVVRQSEYDALGTPMHSESFEVKFFWIPKTSADWTCQSGDNACGRFPTTQKVKVWINNAPRVATHTALGNRIQMDSNTFPVNDIPKLKRVLRHELGHTFGLDHTEVADTIHQLPGTAGCGQCIGINPLDSIMKQGGRDSFTADDIKAIRTLYSDEPNRNNDQCDHVEAFRSLTPLP